MPSIFERWRLASRPSIINVTLKEGDASTQVLNMKAKELYQTQDNLQAVVNFLANSRSTSFKGLHKRRRDRKKKRQRQRSGKNNMETKRRPDKFRVYSCFGGRVFRFWFRLCLGAS